MEGGKGQVALRTPQKLPRRFQVCFIDTVTTHELADNKRNIALLKPRRILLMALPGVESVAAATGKMNPAHTTTDGEFRRNVATEEHEAFSPVTTKQGRT